MKISYTRSAWITPGELPYLDSDEAYVSNVFLCFSPEEREFSGYLKIGIAHVELEVFPREDATVQAIDLLHKEIDRVRGEAADKVNLLLNQIGKLQALEDKS